MDCDYFEPKLSNISFALGNHTFELMPKAYLLDGADLDPEFDGTCIIGISPIPASVETTKMFLFGDTFLRHFY